MTRQRICLMFLFCTLALLPACSGPEAKKQKFISKGKALYEKGDYVRARLELKNAIQIDPKFAAAHYLLGMAELKQGNLGGAFGELNKASELNPRDLEAQVQVGKLLLMQGTADKAQEKATLVLRAQPQHEEGVLLQAAICLATKEPVRAVALMTEMLKRGVNRPDAFLLLASAHRALKDDMAAEKTLLAGVKANAGSLALQRMLADLYAEKGRPDDAAVHIRQMIALEPANYSYSITLAGLYWNTKREAQARELLVKMAAANSTREECLTDVAGFYLSRGKLDDAERVLQQGIAGNPNKFPLRLALSRLYVGSGRVDKGLQLLQECLQLNKDQAHPDIILTKNALAGIYLAKGDLVGAEKLAEQVLKESGHNLEANLIKGRLHMQKGEGAKAVTAFRTIVSDKPDQVPGYLLLAEAHLLNKEQNLALETLQQAQKLAPASPEVLRGLARCQMLKRDFRAAEGTLREVLAKSPKDDMAISMLSQVYLQNGDHNKARQILEGLLARQPEAWGAVNDLACLLSDYGNGGSDLQKALILAQRVHARSPDNPLSQDTLGWIYYRKGDYRKALEYLEKSVAKLGSRPVVRYHAGMALYRAGRSDQAKVHLQAALNGGEAFEGKAEAGDTLKKL